MACKPFPVEPRFWKFVYKTGNCWFWLGHLGSNGYGRIKVNGHQEQAHKVSWELHHGMPFVHICDIRQCVNPEHVFVGTKKENALDASEKGTLWHQYVQQDPDNWFCKKCGRKYQPQPSDLRYFRRLCLTCKRKYWHEWNSRRGAAA